MGVSTMIYLDWAFFSYPPRHSSGSPTEMNSLSSVYGDVITTSN